MDIMSLRSLYHVNASMILIRDDNVYTLNTYLYTLTSEYYLNTYFNVSDGARTHGCRTTCMSWVRSPTSCCICRHTYVCLMP